jgi:cobalt-zinc-cadmium efflux system outer membrane protein
MRSRFFLAVGLTALATTASVASAQSTLTYQQALAMARERAPRVAIARARIEEARGRIVGARIRFRDNPVIDVATGPRKLETGTVTDYEVGINQIFEPGGRRSARVDAAEASVIRETATADASIRQIVRDVAISFVRALQAQTRLDAVRSAEAVAKDALDAADRRYRAGDIAVLDVNVARASLARATAQLRSAEADRASAIGELKALLAWTDGSDPIVEGELRDRIRDGLAVQIGPAAERPEVKMLLAEAAEAQADVRLGQAFKKPDFGVGVRFKRDEGHQAAAAGISVTLPLFSKGQEQIATGLARANRAELERGVVVTELDLRARSALTVFQMRRAAAEPLERDVLPGLEENERLARRSFEVGELSLPDLLVIRREFIDTRLQLVDALADAAMASIDLQAAAGVLR